MITVKDLIASLQKEDPDAPVFGLKDQFPTLVPTIHKIEFDNYGDSSIHSEISTKFLEHRNFWGLKPYTKIHGIVIK